MRALIHGISAQDGAYLAQSLLKKGYEVWGASRDAHVGRKENLERLGIGDACWDGAKDKMCDVVRLMLEAALASYSEARCGHGR